MVIGNKQVLNENSISSTYPWQARIIARLVESVVGILKLNKKYSVTYDGADNRERQLLGDVEKIDSRECNDISINLFREALSLRL